MFIILICAPFCVGSPKGIPFFLCGEDFSGFFLELFPGVITIAAAITTIITAITPLIIITTATTVISGTFIKVKAFPFGEIFQKVSVSISL